MMISLSLSLSSSSCIHSLHLPSYHVQLPPKLHSITCSHLPTAITVISPSSSPPRSSTNKRLIPELGIRKYCLPLALSLIFSCSNPGVAEAGFLSGSTGLESIPGPELPKIEFLDRFNEENQKRYAENDERIKSSPIVKELLERSKKNKEKNKQEILDKYCLRGAEWGVGDCSTAGMTDEEKDSFIAMLKQKAAAAATK